MIFVSHSWHDKPVALRLAHAINGLAPSIDVWLDAERIPLGQSIVDDVELAIRQSSVFALLWSGQAGESSYVLGELRIARRSHTRIVPVLLEDELTPTTMLPQFLGREPKVLRLGMDPGGDRLTAVAAALAVAAVERLQADPEVDLPDMEALLQSLRGMGGILDHLSESLNSESVRSSRKSWIAALGDEVNKMRARGGPPVEGLATSVDLLEEVLAASRQRPTDQRNLHDLRIRAEQISHQDPAGAAQAIKVIDLRLADPLS